MSIYCIGILILDGGGSVALAVKDPNDTFRIRMKTGRHNVDPISGNPYGWYFGQALRLYLGAQGFRPRE